MMSFVEWHRANVPEGRPWVVLGQGPTFSRHVDFPDLERDYHLMGLQRACRARRTHVTHIVDLDVLADIPDISERTDFLVVPWHPHLRFRPSRKTLEDHAHDNAVLARFLSEGRLLWYNLSTAPGGEAKPGCPTVGVRYFSSEPALRLLALAGVRKVRTLGIDGGGELAPEFSDHEPLRAGHATYSLQWPELRKIVAEHGLDFAPLAASP